MIYLFDSLRGLIYVVTCNLQRPVLALYPIKAETFLFGGVPSLSPGSPDISWFRPFDIYAPNYADFIRHPQKYEDNREVQFYFGKHALSQGKYRDALASFEQAEKLSRTDGEKDQARKAIDETERRLDRFAQ